VNQQTSTLGHDLSTVIHDLEARDCEVRAISRAFCNAMWIIDYQEPPAPDKPRQPRLLKEE